MFEELDPDGDDFHAPPFGGSADEWAAYRRWREERSRQLRDLMDSNLAQMQELRRVQLLQLDTLKGIAVQLGEVRGLMEDVRVLMDEATTVMTRMVEAKRTIVAAPTTAEDAALAARPVEREPLASITCPQCAMTSYHPKDVEAGYCGNCHAWTPPPAPRVRYPGA